MSKSPRLITFEALNFENPPLLISRQTAIRIYCELFSVLRPSRMPAFGNKIPKFGILDLHQRSTHSQDTQNTQIRQTARRFFVL
jgi:hypothetical protein